MPVVLQLWLWSRNNVKWECQRGHSLRCQPSITGQSTWILMKQIWITTAAQHLKISQKQGAGHNKRQTRESFHEQLTSPWNRLKGKSLFILCLPFDDLPSSPLSSFVNRCLKTVEHHLLHMEMPSQPEVSDLFSLTTHFLSSLLLGSICRSGGRECFISASTICKHYTSAAVTSNLFHPLVAVFSMTSRSSLTFSCYLPSHPVLDTKPLPKIHYIQLIKLITDNKGLTFIQKHSAGPKDNTYNRSHSPDNGHWSLV